MRFLPSARKNPAFAPRRPRARRTCDCSATTMKTHRLQTGFTRSFRLEPSGPTTTRNTTSREPVNYPYPACAPTFRNGKHLKNRLAMVHNLKLKGKLHDTGLLWGVRGGGERRMESKHGIGWMPPPRPDGRAPEDLGLPVTLGFWVAGYSHWEHSTPTPHCCRETSITASLSTLVSFVAPCASRRFVGRRLALRVFRGVNLVSILPE